MFRSPFSLGSPNLRLTTHTHTWGVYGGGLMDIGLHKACQLRIGSSTFHALAIERYLCSTNSYHANIYSTGLLPPIVHWGQRVLMFFPCMSIVISMVYGQVHIYIDKKSKSKYLASKHGWCQQHSSFPLSPKMQLRG